MEETLWTVTLTPKIEKIMKGRPKVEIRAQICEISSGALIFGGGSNATIKKIIADGQWIMVEREETE